ncbi:MAG: MFS transporter [Hyphomicrobiaceae bacterium]
MPLLFVLALSAFVGAVAVRIVDPVVPDIAHALNSTTATAALLASAFAFPYAFGQPILGPLSDAVGKARIIQVCMAVLAAMLVLSALAPTIETLFAARIVAGLAAGGIFPAAFAMLGDRVAFAERQVTLSRVLMAALAGQLTGAIGSGLIAAAVGWRTVMTLSGILAAAAAIVAMAGLKPRAGVQRTSFTLANMRIGYAAVFRNPRTPICFAAVFVEGLAMFGLLPYVATLLQERAAGGIKEAGFVIAGMGLGGLLFTFAVRKILQVLRGMLNLMRAGGVLAGAGLAAVAFAGPWPWQMAAFTLAGSGFFMLHNSLQTQATELAPSARGSAVALHAFFFFLGQATGPVLYGFGLAVAGPVATILTAAAVMAILGFVIAELLSRVP